MNEILGARIRGLRENIGLTQEQVAVKMSCSRQKYARIEKGLIDISYANITTIAKILGVSSEDITSAVKKHTKQETLFRGYNQTNNGDKFEFISEMIETFYAHKKLYNRVKQVDDDE